MSSSIVRLISRFKTYIRISNRRLFSKVVDTLQTESRFGAFSTNTGLSGSKTTVGRPNVLQPTWSLTEITIPVSKYKNMATLETLTFDNLALRSLPIDPVKEVIPRQVKGACFSRVKPTPVDNPHLVVYAVPAMALLDLPEEELKRKDFVEYFAGNNLLPGSETAAHCYCGHQFGYFSGQLGDGATM